MAQQTELDRLDGEVKTLLLKILERYAYRQRMVVNVMGHGLKHLSELESKRAFLESLDHAFRVSVEVERLFEGLGGVELMEAIRPRMERIPYPESRQELAAGLTLVRRAALASATSYEGCVCKEFAALAMTVARAPNLCSETEEERFIAFAQDESNKRQAQLYWDRWLSLSLLSLGRPGARGDARAVALRLRTMPTAQIVRVFLEDLEPLRKACGLELTHLDTFGVQLPEDLRNRFGTVGLA
ncbi:MAG: hypothetical protein KDB61_00350 [Planctomycetes bacterium]|nr:hypothetical protein [Planctomycetota bacterium]